MASVLSSKILIYPFIQCLLSSPLTRIYLSLSFLNITLFLLSRKVLLERLGNIVAHILLESSLTISHFHSFGLPDSYPSIVGDQDYLRMYYKLDTASISSRILSFLK